MSITELLNKPKQQKTVAEDKPQQKEVPEIEEGQDDAGFDNE